MGRGTVEYLNARPRLPGGLGEIRIISASLPVFARRDVPPMSPKRDIWFKDSDHQS